MELLNRRNAPLAVIGVLSLVLLPGCGGSKNGERAEADRSQQASAAATATAKASSAAPAANTCKYDKTLNTGGWHGTAEYGEVVPAVAVQYGLDPNGAKAAVVDCDRPVPEDDVIKRRQVTVAGAGPCALIATVTVDPPIPGNHVTVACWNVAAG